MNPDRTDALLRHEELRRLVEDVLRRHDPMHLISIGAPHDEYDPEVGTIVTRLKDVSSLLDVCQVLHQELTRWFGAEQAGPSELYMAAAQQLWWGLLHLEAQRLSSEQDVEIVDPAAHVVRFGPEVLSPATIVRIADRFFIETNDQPGVWWMGERRTAGEISVWGQYGSHEEAFVQH